MGTPPSWTRCKYKQRAERQGKIIFVFFFFFSDGHQAQHQAFQLCAPLLVLIPVCASLPIIANSFQTRPTGPMSSKKVQPRSYCSGVGGAACRSVEDVFAVVSVASRAFFFFSFFMTSCGVWDEHLEQHLLLQIIRLHSCIADADSSHYGVNNPSLPFSGGVKFDKKLGWLEPRVEQAPSA
jgi:hypothetical protein